MMAGKCQCTMEAWKFNCIFLMVIVCGGILLNVDAANDVTSAGNLTVVSDGDNGSTVGDAEENDLETFQQMEKRIKGNVGNVVKMLLPYLMRGSANAKVSGPCTSSILKIIGGVRQLKEWAMRFIDATGKIPSGILEGTSISIGDYDECLDIEVGKRDEKPKTPEEVVFRGQYCLMELHRPETINRAIADFESGNKEAPIAKTKTFLSMFVRYKHLTNNTFKVGVCIPSKCSVEDIESIMNTETLKSLVGVVTIASCKQNGEEEEISTVEFILLCMFGCVVGCMILGTFGDMYFRFRGDARNKSESMGYVRLLTSKTSLYGNALDVLSTDGGPEYLHCLTGLRPIIVLVVIYSHTYAHLHSMHFQKFNKAANFLRFFESFTFSGIGNGSVVLDSIVIVAAVTITYSRWRHSEKGKVKLNISRLLLSRYFRMSAAQLLCVSLFMLCPLIGSGPLWSAYVDPMLENCRERWWLNILYIHNYWYYQDICLYHSWILALIMQLTLLGVVVMWILKKSMMFGILFMLLIVVGGIIGVAVMTVIYELPGTLAYFLVDKRTFPIIWNDVFTWPYDHMGPFCIGLTAGYFMAIKKDKLNITRITSIFLWCLSIVCTTSVMFGLYSYKNGDQMVLPVRIFYAVMHRNVWCIGIGWLIVSCSTHHGGAVSRVLKSKFFVPLDRLCYITYLIHMPIMYYHSGSLRERLFMGHLDMLFMAVSYMVISFIAAFLLQIFFVQPYYAVEEHICSLFGSKNKVNFQTKIDMKSTEIPSIISAITETNTTTNGCVNLGYSQKLDGV